MIEKSEVSISSLCSKYKILHANVKYLTRLIDKNGYDILRKNRNRKFTYYFLAAQLPNPLNF